MPSHTAMPKLLNDPEVRGALTGLTDTQQKPLVTYGVFQQQAQTPPNVENLQNIYDHAIKNDYKFFTVGKYPFNCKFINPLFCQTLC